MRYAIWFDKIDVEVIKIEANNKEEAKYKATLLWNLNNKPNINGVEEIATSTESKDGGKK